MSTEKIKMSRIGYKQIQKEGLGNLKTGEEKENRADNRNVSGEIQVDK